MSKSTIGLKKVSLQKNYEEVNIPHEKASKSFKVKLSTKNIKNVSICDLDTNDESCFMPNFVKNYNELISEIKKKTKSDIIKSSPKTEEGKEKRNKSELAHAVDHSKIENMITIVQQKDELKSLTNIEEIKDFYDYTENCLKLISTLKRPKSTEIEDMKIDIPEKLTKKKKLAIFDLDETLIHCELKNIQSADKQIMVKMPSGKEVKVSI